MTSTLPPRVPASLSPDQVILGMGTLHRAGIEFTAAAHRMCTEQGIALGEAALAVAHPDYTLDMAPDSRDGRYIKGDVQVLIDANTIVEVIDSWRAQRAPNPPQEGSDMSSRTQAMRDAIATMPSHQSFDAAMVADAAGRPDDRALANHVLATLYDAGELARVSRGVYRHPTAQRAIPAASAPRSTPNPAPPREAVTPRPRAPHEAPDAPRIVLQREWRATLPGRIHRDDLVVRHVGALLDELKEHAGEWTMVAEFDPEHAARASSRAKAIRERFPDLDAAARGAAVWVRHPITEAAQ